MKGGLCYIETANLDGETNLKNKESVEETHKAMWESKATKITTSSVSERALQFFSKLEVRCEHPNDNLNAFHGTIMHPDWPQRVGVTNKQV